MLEKEQKRKNKRAQKNQVQVNLQKFFLWINTQLKLYQFSNSVIHDKGECIS